LHGQFYEVLIFNLMKKILIVDDEEAARYGIRRALEQKGIEIFEAENAGAARVIVDGQHPDLMLADINMPGEDGISLLRSLQGNPLAPRVIMITAYSTAKVAVEAMKAGAYDYVTKPFDIDELRLVAQRALNLIALETENRELKKQVLGDGQFGKMIGRSQVMRLLFDIASQVAGSDVTVLITGDSGTGKEMLAQEIHDRSLRASGPFVAVNCAALPDTLIESELFGHEKGAFTGAAQLHKGKFEQAHRGTLFLDEIGDMNPLTQAKVLRALEEKKIERLGGTAPVPVDVRILSATHKNLEAEVQNERFRQDLFYRLKVVSLELPPLRERREDIPLLAESFCRIFAARHRKGDLAFASDSMDHLCNYSWPGNLRELRNVVERCVVLRQARTIQVSDLPAELREPPGLPSGGGKSSGARAPYFSLPFKDARRQFEIEYLQARLKGNQNNISRTAAQIGLHRQSLQQKLKELGIER
jgi:DNA-binding NtrC family response regulator